MAKINLLPWREERREKRKQQFFAVSLGVAIIGIALSGLVWMFFNHQLNQQNEANQTITAANQELDNKLKQLDGLEARRDEILDRMKVIQNLQALRPVVVHVFDEIVKVTPANMYITSFERAGDKFTIQGKAQDPLVVSDFLRNLGASPWFRNAFMNSFQAAEAKTQQQGGVAPRPEDSYGTFVVTVDLGDIEAMQQQAAPAPANQPQAASADQSANAGGTK